MTGRFYLYVHTRRDTGAPFYVGKGTGRRAWSKGKSARGRYWRSIERKHGRDVHIILRDDDEEAVFLAEVELIDKYRMMGFELSNATAGGEGAKITDPEVEARRVAAVRAALAKPEVRAKLSASIRASRTDQEFMASWRETIKAAWTRPEAKARKSAASKAIAAKRRVPVCCNELGKTFLSMADAVAWLRENGWPSASASKICVVCQGERKIAYGYTWQYA